MLASEPHGQLSLAEVPSASTILEAAYYHSWVIVISFLYLAVGRLGVIVEDSTIYILTYTTHALNCVTFVGSPFL